MTLTARSAYERTMYDWDDLESELQIATLKRVAEELKKTAEKSGDHPD
jgi:hypothetical protein